MASETLAVVTGGHKNGVVDGGAELDSADGNRRDEGKAFAEKMRETEVDENGGLDDGNENDR